MDEKLIVIAGVIVLVIAIMQSHENEAQSAASASAFRPAPTADFAASTEKPFDQLPDQATNPKHAEMKKAEYFGEADHDFVATMIAHHRGAIDMARAVLLYNKDPQIRRLAQEIITDQQSEIQLMELWLKQQGRKP